jgi:hypothetical protein
MGLRAGENARGRKYIIYKWNRKGAVVAKRLEAVAGDTGSAYRVCLTAHMNG